MLRPDPMSKVLPPQWPLRLLRLFLHPSYVEEIEGDILEVFEDDLETLSARRARIRFYLEIIKILRPNLIRKFHFLPILNFTLMIRHTLLVARRNFFRYKSSFFINLIGLSSGLTISLLIFLWVQDERAIDKFHVNQDRLFQLLEHVEQGTGMITRVTTAGPTARTMAEEIPEVEKAATTTWITDLNLSVEERLITTKGFYASEDFFELFSFRLLQGNPATALSDKSSIVISESTAHSLFGSVVDAMGKTVKFRQHQAFQVAGIMEDPPTRSSLQVHAILPFKKYWDDNEWVRKWTNTAPRTYALLKENTDLASINSRLKTLIVEKTEGNVAHRAPFLTKFADHYLYNKYENGVQAGGRIVYVRLFAIISLFLVLIACINFMNLSTARASRRLKEVGIKKTIGTPRWILVAQYLGESVFMVAMAYVMAIVMVLLLLPQFNFVTGKTLALTFSPVLLGLSLGVVVITGLIAGSYPAFYLTSFKTISILKGHIYGKIGEALARKSLVIFQFTLSIILMVAFVVVRQQIEFAQQMNLGYNKENILMIRKSGAFQQYERLQTFMEELKKQTGIAGVALSAHDMTGHNGGTYGVVWPGKDPADRTEFENFMIGYGMMDLLEIKVKEGRNFDPDLQSDSSAIVFNEAAIDFMGLSDPIGQNVTLWGKERKIVGVVKDFHFESVHEVIKPLFMIVNPGRTRHIMVKISSGNISSVVANIERLHQEFNPGFQFNSKFLDQDYNELYESEEKISTISSAFGIIAVIISCLGILGLATFSAERKTKEVGIRKILGANHFSIIHLLARDLMNMVLIALLIGLPLSFWISTSWLENFAYRTQLGWWVFAGAALLALSIAAFTIATQTLKASRSNPVDCLRSE